MRVLYVEDDDNLAFAVEQMLKQEGHDCARARSGLGAVKLGQENEYDVILLDVMLPDIDGYEVLRQLQDVGVETPVLIQSGLVERDRSMDGLGFGVDDYLIKPFNRDELIRRVEQAANRNRGDAPMVRDDPAKLLPTLPPPGSISTPEFAPAPVPAPEPEPSASDDAPPSDAPPLPDEVPDIPARIVAASVPSIIDCKVVSVAAGGAVLDLSNETAECPEEFLLAVTGDKSYRCESCWRHGAKVGVKFV